MSLTKKVTRYTERHIYGDGLSEADDGEYVKHEEYARLRSVLESLKARLIEVNAGIPEMGNIDTELVATIDCALESRDEPGERHCACIAQMARTWKYCTDCGGRIPQNRPAELAEDSSADYARIDAANSQKNRNEPQ